MPKGSQGTRIRLCSLRMRWKALAGSRAPGVKRGILEAKDLGTSLFEANDECVDVDCGLDASNVSGVESFEQEPEFSDAGLV